MNSQHHVCSLRGALLLTVLLGACAGRHAVDRDAVSLDVAQRVGHPLRDAPGEADVPPGVQLDDGLDVDEAVALALWNDADFELTLSQLGYARADLVQAGLLQNPTLSLLFPLGPRQWQLAISMPFDALWLLPKRLAAARLRSRSTGERLVQGGLDLVRDTKVAFARAVAAEARVVELQALVAVQEARLDLELHRVRLGDAALIDVDLVRARALQTATELDVARMALAEARTMLRQRVRVVLPAVLQPSPSPSTWPSEVTLTELARASRPDLRAAELEVEAAEELLALARRSAVAAALGLDVRGGNALPLDGSVSLAVGLPIFDRNQAGILRARTDVEAAVARVEATAARIDHEVRLALAQGDGSRRTQERLTSERLPAMAEALRRVREAHRAGDVSAIEVAIVEEAWLRARLAGVEAELALGEATAQLERAVGGRVQGEGGR